MITSPYYLRKNFHAQNVPETQNFQRQMKKLTLADIGRHWQNFSVWEERGGKVEEY